MQGTYLWVLHKLDLLWRAACNALLSGAAGTVNPLSFEQRWLAEQFAVLCSSTAVCR